MKALLLIAVLMLAGFSWSPVEAQTASATAVTSCGIAPNSSVSGNPYPNTQDLQGKLCAGMTHAYLNITTATSTLVKTGAGLLHEVCINTPVASGTVQLYDNTAASGTKIGLLTTPSTITGESPFCQAFDVQFSTGLEVVTTGLQDITIAYR